MPRPTSALPTRTFGVEIEAYNLERWQVDNEIRDADFGADILDQCASFSDYHRVVDYWKIVEDESLGGHYSFEAVSPILTGEEGIKEVCTVARALSAAGGKVNRSCGLHVHIDVSDFSTSEVANIIKRYARFESQIDSFMPESRRGRQNRWANSVIPWSQRISGDADESIHQIECEQYTRYLKVNLECYSRQGTIEFRQHAGTLNHRKIENWVRFLLHFVEASRMNTVAEVPTAPEEEVIVRRAARNLVTPIEGVELFSGVPSEVVEYLHERIEHFASR